MTQKQRAGEIEKICKTYRLGKIKLSKEMQVSCNKIGVTQKFIFDILNN